MTRTRANITTKVNAKAIRREKLEGEDYIVVPSSTLPDDVVMNGVLYPADEIAKSFMTLENTFAPFGHPDKAGTFLNANDPIAIDRFHIGAHNRNVRRENGRVHLDKYIHVTTAENSARGKRVLDAIEKGEPIHTSTALYAIMENANGEVPYSRIAREIVFDHDAILLDEEGAATPEQGVGMLVNSNGEKEQVPVINSMLEDDADRDIDWALTHLAQAVERRKAVSKVGEMKAALLKLFGFTDRETPTNSKEAEMSEVTKADFDKLAGEVKTLTDGFSKIGETIANAVKETIAPVTAHVEALANSQKAKDEAELKELRGKIVAAGTLTEAAANALTSLDVARELAPKEPGAAAALNGAFSGKKDDKRGTYQPPADDDGKEG